MADMETRGWRDIETAPRDGTEVLLWCAWWDGPGMKLGKWCPDRKHWRVDYSGGNPGSERSCRPVKFWAALPTPPEDTGHAILSNTKEGG